MPATSFEIRICNSCGLRYPAVEEHPFGTRCPACLGETSVILSRQLIAEPGTNPHPRDFEDGEQLLLKKKEEGTTGMAVLLDSIRSAWNVGSILRSADGFGFSHAYLCGITPRADHEAVTKTSLGAEDAVPWSYHKDAVKLVKGLKKEGWTALALEEERRALPVTELRTAADLDAKPRVLIVGNEVTGVDPELLDLCDSILYIPMRGEKKSFNVAIAFGIAAYALSVRQLAP